MNAEDAADISDIVEPDVSGADQEVGGILGTISKAFWWVLLVLGVASAAGLFITVIVDVTLRYTVGSSIPGANDMVASWWMVSIVFMGIALAQHSGGRIQVDFLVDALPPALRRIVDTVIFALIAAIGLLLMVTTFIEAMHQMSIGEYAPIGHRLIWPFRFVVPLGFLGFSFACVLSIVHIWSTRAKTSQREGGAS